MIRAALSSCLLFPLLPQDPAARPEASPEEQRIRERMRDPAKRAAFMREHFPDPVFDKTAPELPAGLKPGGILIFSKTNGFRDTPAIRAANETLDAIATRRGWPHFQTENGAVMNADQLRQFRLVIWSNTSGDTLTEDQRAAFRTWIENGGVFVGIHGAGGDPPPTAPMFAPPRSAAAWKWYVETLLGAQFVVHSRIVPATIRVEDTRNPIMKGLPETWQRSDEWYSFETNPRGKAGFHILATVDEKTYEPGRATMGADHPLVWWHCVGKGRAVYSALGHAAEFYAEPLMQKLLENAMEWGVAKGGSCPEGE
ncbi:MAG: ThuA domain-containing protein [Bryobacteraceae bacterium]